MGCPGNICQGDLENHLRNWWPGEAACTARPYKKFQKVQNRLNKLLLKGKLRHPDTYYFLKDLEKVGRTTHQTRGIPSEKKYPTTDYGNTPVAKKVPYNTHKSRSNIAKMALPSSGRGNECQH